MDQNGELARRPLEGEEEEEDSDEKGSYIDPAAALEMARFGLSRKQTAALDEALEKEKEDAEKRKKLSESGIEGGMSTAAAAGLNNLVNDSDA